MIPEHDDQNGEDDFWYEAPFCEGCGEQCDPSDLNHDNLCPDCQEEEDDVD